MALISDLYTHFMNLVNQKYYNKTESDSKYIQDLEINIESDGKIYIVDTLQDSLVLISSSDSPSLNDTITLTATLRDSENRGISHTPIRFYNDDTLIGTGITQNNGSVSITYNLSSEGDYSFTASTRKKVSNTVELEIAQVDQIRLKLRINSNTCPYDEDDGYEYSQYSSINGVIDWGDGTTPNTFLNHWYAEEGEYDVVINTDNVTGLYETFYENLALVSFDASDCLTLESIGYDIFEDCNNLESVILPSSLTEVDGFSFSYGQSNLSSITFLSTTPPTAYNDSFVNIPSDCVIYVPYGSLSAYTSAENYPNPNTYTYREIPPVMRVNITTDSNNNTFALSDDYEDCLTFAQGHGIVDFGDGTTSRAYQEYSYDNLSHTYSTNGDYVVSITGDLSTLYGAFDNDDGYLDCVRSIELPESIRIIVSESFSNMANITDIDFSQCKYLHNIGEELFEECPHLTKIDLSHCVSLTEIPSNFINRYASVEELILPSSITTIDDYAFYDNSCLKSITFTSTVPPTADTDSFTGLSTDCVIRVPNGSLNAYMGASNYPYSSDYTYVEYSSLSDINEE